MALWLKVSASIATHPKFLKVGPTAGWLWLAGVGYCRIGSTDGFIPAIVAPALLPGLKQPQKHIAALVGVGLWQPVSDGYHIHDYLDWNPSREEVEGHLQKDRDRKRGASPSGFRAESERNPNGIQKEPSRARRACAISHSVSPSDSEDLTATESTEISTEAPAWRQRRNRPASLTEGEAYHRRNCAPWAYAACQAGICVPRYLWPQWQRRHASDVAALRACVETWAPKAQGDTAEKFWPAAFEAHFGAAAPATGRQSAAAVTIATAQKGW